MTSCWSFRHPCRPSPTPTRGGDGARRYLAAFDGAVEDVRLRAEELHAEDGCVLALVNVTGRGAASGLPVSMHAASIIRVTDGEVTAIESHPDLAAAREALTRR